MMSRYDRDGGIRRLWPADIALFRDHLLRLDAAGRHDRFHGGINDASLELYAARALGGGTIVFAWVESGRVLGVSEMHIAGANEAAECAFSVEPNLRRKGLGTALFARVMDEARDRHIKQIRVSCMAANMPMRALSRKFGATFTFEGGEAVGIIDVTQVASPPLATEMFEDAFRMTARMARFAADPFGIWLPKRRRRRPVEPERVKAL